MGSEEVSLKDYAYMRRLQEKLKEEYENQLRRKEAARAEAERERMRRLLRDGIITADDLREDFNLIGQQEKPPQRTASARNNTLQNKKSKKPDRRSKSAAPAKNNKKSKPNGEIVRYNSATPRYQTQGYRPRSTAEIVESHMSDKYEDDWQQNNDYESDEERHTEEVEHSDEYIRSKYKHPILRKMYREKTVDGMYELADKLQVSWLVKDGTSSGDEQNERH